MPNVTIEETETSLQWQGGVAPTLIIEAAAPFFTAEGIPVNNGGGPFRVEYETEVDEETLIVTIPQVTLPSTEDSSIPTVTYYAYFQKANAYDAASKTPYATFGSQRGFRVPASPTTTTWEDLDANMGGTFTSAPADKSVGGNLDVAGNFTLGGDIDMDGEFVNMPNAPGYKVGGVQVVGAQGLAIADPDGTTEGNTEAIKQMLALFRDWGAVSNLYPSTLNDGLVSLWLLNNVNDAADGNHLTNSGGVTFGAQGANLSGANQLSVADNSSFHVHFRQSFTVAARVRLGSKAASQAIISKADGASANEYLLAYVSAADGFDKFRFNLYPGGNTVAGVTASTPATPATATDYLVVGWYDALANTVNIQVDGGTVYSAAATLTSHPYTAAFAVGALMTSTPSLRLNGSVRFAALWSKVLTGEERTELFENQTALTYPLKDETTAREEHIIQRYSLFDDRAQAYTSAEAGYNYALPYSRAVFVTSATSMDVEFYSNEGEAALPGRLFNVRVNGVDFELLEAPVTPGVTTLTVPLSAGSNKTVEAWTGFQALFSGVVKGTWLRRVSFNAPAQIKMPSNKSPHMVIYGDSIACGAGADIPTREGWTMLLRDAYPGSVAIEAWGGRSLFQDAPDGTARAVFVQKVVTQAPDVIWLAIGTNDYGGPGFGEQSAANFGTAYAALLDDLHAALPAAAIYAQSMLPRSAETANNFSNTLAQYRTQVSTACATRAWATFVDGTAVPGFNVGTDLADTVHLNTGGHSKQKNYALTKLGL